MKMFNALEKAAVNELNNKSKKCGEKYNRGFRAQFGNPAGFWGKLAGMIMAYNPSNRERALWVISLLKVQKNDRVLEIGFGPGWAIQQISKVVTEGDIAGIDRSEVMVEQARKRNREAISRGRVDLRLGTVSNLPLYSEPFDKVFSINSIQFWDDPVENLKGLRGLLKPSGLIAIALQPRNPGATEEDTETCGKEIVKNLEAAGFSQVRLEIKKMKPVSTVCALGVRNADNLRF